MELDCVLHFKCYSAIRVKGKPLRGEGDYE